MNKKVNEHVERYLAALPVAAREWARAEWRGENPEPLAEWRGDEAEVIRQMLVAIPRWFGAAKVNNNNKKI